ncbi:MAG: hypothetical protein KDD70_03235 [Bdellovibrionales bacterium]|nr:hypothetical protein [Bdellovibrionales bacterium]
MSEAFKESVAPLNNWKDRLALSRQLKKGFAAPGGLFTRACALWLQGDRAASLRHKLIGGHLLELGAGMYHYGYQIATLTSCERYTGVEPYYADVLSESIHTFSEGVIGGQPRASVVASDMLSHLKTIPDNSCHVLACGIENCILPDDDYKSRVEREIVRVLGADHLFLVSQSDLAVDLPLIFHSRIPSHVKKRGDLLRLYSKKELLL